MMFRVTVARFVVKGQTLALNLTYRKPVENETNIAGDMPNRTARLRETHTILRDA